MTTDFSEYPETSWEFAAWHTIREHDMDVPSNITQSFESLFEADMFAAIARRAWAELRTTTSWNINDQVALLARKQHDYGHKNVERFGRPGVCVRLWDKIARHENLQGRLKVGPRGKEKAFPAGELPALNESFQDTLRDIIGYSVIMYMVQSGKFAYVLRDDDVIG